MFEIMDGSLLVFAWHDAFGDPAVVAGVNIHVRRDEVDCLLADDCWASCSTGQRRESYWLNWFWLWETLDSRRTSWLGLGSWEMLCDEGRCLLSRGLGAADWGYGAWSIVTCFASMGTLARLVDLPAVTMVSPSELEREGLRRSPSEVLLVVLHFPPSECCL